MIGQGVHSNGQLRRHQQAWVSFLKLASGYCCCCCGIQLHLCLACKAAGLLLLQSCCAAEPLSAAGACCPPLTLCGLWSQPTHEDLFALGTAVLPMRQAGFGINLQGRCDMNLAGTPQLAKAQLPQFGGCCSCCFAFL